MFRLLSEYDNKPGLAPPLVIVEDVWKLVKIVWKRTCRRKRENLEAMMTQDLEMLSLFEKDCLHEYLANEGNNKDAITDLRLTKLEESVQRMLKILEEPDPPVMTMNGEDQADYSEIKQSDLSNRILTAKLRSQTAKTRQNIAALENKIDKNNDETNIALEAIEQTLEVIKEKIFSKPSQEHEHHHHSETHKKSRRKSKRE